MEKIRSAEHNARAIEAQGQQQAAQAQASGMSGMMSGIASGIGNMSFGGSSPAAPAPITPPKVGHGYMNSGFMRS